MTAIGAQKEHIFIDLTADAHAAEKYDHARAINLGDVAPALAGITVTPLRDEEALVVVGHGRESTIVGTLKRFKHRIRSFEGAKEPGALKEFWDTLPSALA